MRILCSITVGAFLLSIVIAETDWPFGSRPFRSDQYRHQIQPRLITLTSVEKLKSESSLLEWLVNMVSQMVEPQKKLPPTIIGPINVPGISGKVYLKKSMRYHPRESNPVVIKMVTHDLLTEDGVHQDLSHRLEYPPREESKLHSYQTSLTDSQYAKWQYHPHSQNYGTSNAFSKPSFGFTSNDDKFHNREQYYEPQTFLLHNYHNENYRRLQPASANSHRGTEITTVAMPPLMHHFIDHQRSNTDIPSNRQYSQHHKSIGSNFLPDHYQSSKPDPLRYLDYASTAGEKNLSTISNATEIEENAFPSRFPAIREKYKQMITNDKTVPNYHQNYRQFVIEDEISSRSHSNVQKSRVFHPGSMIKFEIDDIAFGDTTATNMKYGQNEDATLNKKNYHQREILKDSVMKKGVNSISMRDAENIAHDDPETHGNQAQIESQIPQISPSRLPSYKIIDESYRSGGIQNISSEPSAETLKRDDRIDNHLVYEKINSMNTKFQDHVKTGTATTEVLRAVFSSTESNLWRFQGKRTPTRVVKAIYRRKPVNEIKKNYSIGTRDPDTSIEVTDSPTTSGK